jgi:hypothetical protein
MKSPLRATAISLVVLTSSLALATYMGKSRKPAEAPMMSAETPIEVTNKSDATIWVCIDPHNMEQISSQMLKPGETASKDVMCNENTTIMICLKGPIESSNDFGHAYQYEFGLSSIGKAKYLIWDPKKHPAMRLIPATKEKKYFGMIRGRKTAIKHNITQQEIRLERTPD